METIEYCPFVEFGCECKDNLHNLQKHLKHTPAKHLSFLCDGISDLYSEYRRLQLTMEEDDRYEDITAYRIQSLCVIFSCPLIWRIDEIKHKIQLARDNVEPSLFSPPFYTGRHGYKMALSIVWRGDGEAKGKYVSLFVSLLKGEFDSLLPWPFAHTITLSLLDQRHDNQNRTNVVQRIIPNVSKDNRPFLGRPVGDRNPRFGLQKFVEIKELNTADYVIDDTMFIKADIDVSQINPI